LRYTQPKDGPVILVLIIFSVAYGNFPPRYTIPYLLKCPFFKLAVGIKVDLVLPLEVDPDKPELVKLQLRLGDPKLRKDKHKDNEAIQFDFDLVKDNPEKISKELVSV
jgi:WNK lysine deficient protein kinase